jgi:ABC-type branched-subunit amino acid transport system substrate-binding protein
LHIGIISDLTGLQSGVTGISGLNTLLAGLKAANAAGGVNGYKFSWKIYDAGSNPATGLIVAREAISDGDFAVLANWGRANTGLPALAAAGVPTIGDGGGGTGWTGPPDLFSVTGNVYTQNTTAWWDVLVKEGKTNIAIPGGTINPQVVAQWTKALAISGAHSCYDKVGIDGTNTASLVAVAHEIISAHCQGVVVPDLYPGALQLQIALNQLGAKIPVEDIIDSGSAVIKQAGSSADNLVYANQVATAYDTADPGVAQYLQDMQTYEPSQDPHCGRCVLGYVVSKFFLNGISHLQGPATQKNLLAVLNSTTNYTADNLVAPITFPAYHTTGTLCLSYQIIQNGQWVPLVGGAYPFICGKRFGANGEPF